MSYRIGWFSTGRGKGSRELLRSAMLAIRDGSIKAQIDFVFLSRAPGEHIESDRFIELVQSYNLPLVCYSYQAYKAEHAAPDDM